MEHAKSLHIYNLVAEKFKDFSVEARARARQIIERKFEKFFFSPSEARASQIEESVGLLADWSDADHGEGPKR